MSRRHLCAPASMTCAQETTPDTVTESVVFSPEKVPTMSVQAPHECHEVAQVAETKPKVQATAPEPTSSTDEYDSHAPAHEEPGQHQRRRQARPRHWLGSRLCPTYASISTHSMEGRCPQGHRPPEHWLDARKQPGAYPPVAIAAKSSASLCARTHIKEEHSRTASSLPAPCRAVTYADEKE